MIEILLIVLFSLFGVLLGVITGLLPGLHVNNVALLIVSTSGIIISVCMPLTTFGVSTNFLLVLIAGFIMSISISHSFHDTIPTTFIGAPEEDTALAVLPAHRLLLKGEGYKAVTLAVLGSIGAMLVCLALLVPLRFIIGPPLNAYLFVRDVMAWLLIAVVLLLLATEKTRITELGTKGWVPSAAGILFAAFVFLLSGLFGLLIFNFPVSSPLGLPAPVLFPALAGLFGLPTLLTSVSQKPVIPPQTVEPFFMNSIEKKASIVSTLTGSLAGILVSIIPGLTTATGTVLAMTARQKQSSEQTIVTLSAVNTASSFFVLIILFVLLRPRSGVTIAINELLPIEAWTGVSLPTTLIYLLMFLVLSGVFSYFLCLYIGKVFAKKFHRIPYTTLVLFTIVLVISLVFLFTGIMGLLVLFAATCIGFLPLCWGVRRSHCMGVLLLPIILYFL